MVVVRCEIVLPVCVVLDGQGGGSASACTAARTLVGVGRSLQAGRRVPVACRFYA